MSNTLCDLVGISPSSRAAWRGLPTQPAAAAPRPSARHHLATNAGPRLVRSRFAKCRERTEKCLRMPSSPQTLCSGRRQVVAEERARR